MFDRLIRYLPVLDYIRNYKPARILEVGSSSKGLGEFYAGKFTGVDLNFPEKPVENMEAVKGSVYDLPFPDASFDLAVAIDMFEHVKEEVRGKALEEMLRVCKGTVIVGYPCGEGAEKLSKKMLAWFRSRNSGTAKWMEEHVSFGLPNEKFEILRHADLPQVRNSKFEMKSENSNKEKITKNLDSGFRQNDNVREFNNENLWVCEWLLKLEENGRFLKIERYVLMHLRSELEFLLRRLNFGKCYRKIYFISSII